MDIFNLTIADKFTNLNEKKKTKNSSTKSFIFNQINKLTIKIYSNLSNVNIRYYLKFPIPTMHRQIFKILSQNPEYVKTHCFDL